MTVPVTGVKELLTPHSTPDSVRLIESSVPDPWSRRQMLIAFDVVATPSAAISGTCSQFLYVPLKIDRSDVSTLGDCVLVVEHVDRRLDRIDHPEVEHRTECNEQL